VMSDIAGIAKKGWSVCVIGVLITSATACSTLSTYLELPCHQCSLSEVVLVNLRQALVDDRGCSQ